MQTPPLHENLRTHSLRSSPPRGKPESRRQGTSAILGEDGTDIEVAIELIEMRYQEYCARMEMEALFAEGILNCL
jgi:hypothetical protein